MQVYIPEPSLDNEGAQAHFPFQHIMREQNTQKLHVMLELSAKLLLHDRFW